MNRNNTKYYKIYNELLKLILKGEWKIGHKIPSENDLKKYYNVSRLTIRKALENLCHENLIAKNKGKKSTVLARIPIGTKVLLTTSLDEAESKKNRRSKLIDFKLKKFNYKKNKFFQNEPIFEIIRCFYDLEVPAFIATGKVIQRNLPELKEKDFLNKKFTNASLSEILKGKYKLKIFKQKITAFAINLTDNESVFFKVPKKYPGTKFISYYYDNKDHLIFMDEEISLKEIYLENIFS
jgi:DNA-binding GntR family transcriptional regulator|tara:strand:- start:780 stop:1493 length:714 start_codon:yes stop_codon:yes gene_type:complete